MILLLDTLAFQVPAREINPELIIFLAETLYVYDNFNEIINKNKNM